MSSRSIVTPTALSPRGPPWMRPCRCWHEGRCFTAPESERCECGSIKIAQLLWTRCFLGQRRGSSGCGGVRDPRGCGALLWDSPWDPAGPHIAPSDPTSPSIPTGLSVSPRDPVTPRDPQRPPEPLLVPTSPPAPTGPPAPLGAPQRDPPYPPGSSVSPHSPALSLHTPPRSPRTPRFFPGFSPPRLSSSLGAPSLSRRSTARTALGPIDAFGAPPPPAPPAVAARPPHSPPLPPALGARLRAGPGSGSGRAGGGPGRALLR